MREGEELIVLRDPLGVAEPAAVDRDFALVLDNLDGTKTVPQLRQSLLMKHGLDISLVALGDFVDDLRAAALLDDDRFREAWQDQSESFHASPVRESTAAGTFYAERSSELQAELAAIFPTQLSAGAASGSAPTPRATDAAPREPGAESKVGFFSGDAIGIVIPSQPLDACPELLAAVMRRLPSPSSIDLIAVIGTDFVGGLLPYVGTDKGYATSRGILRSDLDLVDELEERVPWLLREDLRHRQADGIELAALLLREAYGVRCPPALFLLCGREAVHGDDPTTRDELLGHLEVLLGRRRVLFVCVGELSHAGPAFGGAPLEDATLKALEEYDRDCLAPLLRGQIERFAGEIRRPGPAGSPSGGAALDLLLRILPTGCTGELLGYRQLAVPGQLEGLIGVAGIAFRAPA